MMRCTTYLIILCYASVYSNALSLPQATPMPLKRYLSGQNNTLANATVHDLGNSSASGNSFALRVDPQGGTLTMDVGPVSSFIPPTPCREIPTGTGYVICPTNYNELTEIPEDGMTVVLGNQTSNDLLDKFNEICVPDKLNDPACIEGLGEVFYAHAPDLQKRFLPVLGIIYVVIAVDAVLLAVYAEMLDSSGPVYKPVPQIHYKSSVLASMSSVSASRASVIVVETTTGDTKAITMSTAELTAFNPSPTASHALNPTGLLTTDSSGHFVIQAQSSDMSVLRSAEAALASPTPSCTIGSAPLVERDDTDAKEEVTCVANRLMESAPGLMNPNGLMSTFRTRVEELAQQIVPDFVPVFQDVRVAGAFGLFLLAADTIIPLLFPGLAQTAWLIAGFIAFGVTMLPLASNTQGKLQPANGLTQIVLQVTKGKTGSGTEAICPPEDQPYDCASFFCNGNANNVCTGVWSENCPCTTCPSKEDMPNCNTCNTATNTNYLQGKCATENRGCPCYFETTQNSNYEDLDFQQLVVQIAGSTAKWASGTSFPYMEGVVCRPDNSWYRSCQYPNTETGYNFGANEDVERVLRYFFTAGTPNGGRFVDPVPNPTLPQGMMMEPTSKNVTFMYPTNKGTVDVLVNVAWETGCTSPNGQMNIMDPIGDGSISGLDVLRGTYYGCMNMAASYDPKTNMVDMVPGSAGKGNITSSGPNLYARASNSGVGGWNQIGCIIYEVIPLKYRTLLTENPNSPDTSILQPNWAKYQEDWPNYARVYYENGAWYCKQPGKLSASAPPPCSAFPCPLGTGGNSLDQIHNLIQT